MTYVPNNETFAEDRNPAYSLEVPELVDWEIKEWNPQFMEVCLNFTYPLHVSPEVYKYDSLMVNIINNTYF